MIRVAALDDEPHALEVIKKFCEASTLVETCAVFSKPAEALQYAESHPVDLFFLDINMPVISGIQLRKKLDPGTMVVFATAHSVYAAEGFNLNVLDYLLKPYSFERFSETIRKAVVRSSFERKKAGPGDYILLRVNYAMVKIELGKILYIQGVNDYIRVYLIDQSIIMSRTTLKALEDKLPSAMFMRVHRSYIVSLAKITRAQNKTIFLGTYAIPVGNGYEKFAGLNTAVKSIRLL